MQIIVLPVHGLGHLIKYPKKGLDGRDVVR